MFGLTIPFMFYIIVIKIKTPGKPKIFVYFKFQFNAE